MYTTKPLQNTLIKNYTHIINKVPFLLCFSTNVGILTSRQLDIVYICAIFKCSLLITIVNQKYQSTKITMLNSFFKNKT